MKLSRSLFTKGLLIATMAVTFAAPALAANEMQASEIHVNGEASRQVAPSYAILDLGISNKNASVTAAKSSNDAIMSTLISQLKNLGIDKSNIQTSNVSVSPDYDYNRTGSDRNTPSGYTVRNTVSVRINDLDKVGKVVDAAINSGANNVNSLSFQSDISQSLNDQLTTEAIASARHQAEVIAAALGRTVGPVKSANVQSTETQSFDAAPRYMALRMAAMSTNTPVESGNMVASKSASVTFYLQ